MTEQPTPGWAFLVARGRRKGYQSLLMPEFLVQGNEYGALGQLSSSDQPGSAPRISRIEGLASGDLALAYVTYRLTPADLAGTPAVGPVTDEFGRPLELLYGVVCRGLDIIGLDDSDLATAHIEALQTYQRFLADESGFVLASAQPFALRSITAPMPVRQPAPVPPQQPPLGLLEQPEFIDQPPVRRRPPYVPILAIAAVAVIALIAGISVLGGDDGKISKVDFVAPTTNRISCDSPVKIQAKVTADKATTIQYHWESDPDLSAEEGNSVVELKLPKGDTIIETTVDLSDEANPTGLTQSFVIDSANDNTNVDHRYQLTCR
ncbi:hypothetical protein [Kribbella ginsengisoli]|uniref:Ig-like domain-containing protein n=1 Tax=Kribbella ginsengisoli TaxID=363865 RepID=A0ABP6Z2E8_9ACTN